METKTAFTYLEIRKFGEDTVVQRLDLTNTSERSREKIESGANMNLNHEQYYTEIVESETELPKV